MCGGWPILGLESGKRNHPTKQVVGGMATLALKWKEIIVNVATT